MVPSRGGLGTPRRGRVDPSTLALILRAGPRRQSICPHATEGESIDAYHKMDRPIDARQASWLTTNPPAAVGYRLSCGMGLPEKEDLPHGLGRGWQPRALAAATPPSLPLTTSTRAEVSRALPCVSCSLMPVHYGLVQAKSIDWMLLRLSAGWECPPAGSCAFC